MYVEYTGIYAENTHTSVSYTAVLAISSKYCGDSTRKDREDGLWLVLAPTVSSLESLRKPECRVSRALARPDIVWGLEGLEGLYEF